MFGDRLNVVVNDCKSDCDMIDNLLKESKIKIVDIRPIPPSLENVFMHLIREVN